MAAILPRVAERNLLGLMQRGQVTQTMEEIQASPDIDQRQAANIYGRSNLTRLQLLYWMGHKLRPGTPLFNAILTFTISGEVNREHFEKAFLALLEHCDALQTVIEEIDGVPHWKLVSDYSIKALEYVDLSSDPELALQAWLKKRSIIPLNLEVCLFDSALIKIGPDQFVWYLNQDHLITDASSAFLIFDRLAKLYELSLKGAALSLPGLPTFEKYIDYECKYRSSSQALKSRAYWKQKLTPGPEPVSFWGKTPVKKSSEVQRVTYNLDFERSQELRAIARRDDIFIISEDFSLYNIFGTILFILLHRISGNHRLGLVTPVHNRFTELFKNTVGLLLELSPFQVEISEDESYISLITMVKREARETLTHYQYGSGLSLQQNSFDVMFNMYQTPALEIDRMPVQVKRIHPGHGTESLALHVNDHRSSGTFELNFDFHCDVFDEAQREKTILEFVQITDAFLENETDGIVKIISQEIEKPHQLSGDSKLKHSFGNGQADSRVPQDILEQQLIEIWEEVLGIRPIGVDDNFFDLGGNSWLAVRLFVKVEELTDQYLPLTTLLNTATISELASVIRREMGEKLWSTLITIQPGNGKNPLYMVPGAGGNGLTVARIAKHLGQDRPVHMFQIPLGDEDETAPITSIQDMAAHYVEALLKVQSEGPYLLGGYSAGGLVAFEVAQQLREQGQRVDFLAIIDVAAQGTGYRYVRHITRGLSTLFRIKPDKELKMYLYLRDSLFRLNYFLRVGYGDTAQRYGSAVRRQVGRPKRFLELERQEKKNRLLRKIRAVNEETYKENLDNHTHYNKVEEGDFAWSSEDRYMRRYFEINNIAVKCYVPKLYPGRITLFRSTDGYQYPEQRSPDAQLGWRRFAADGLEVYEIPGTHLQMVREPNVKVLGDKLRACLDRVQ